LEEINAHLEGHEQVRFIGIVDGPWTVFNGHITPTLKLKRNVVEHRYQKLAEDWNLQNAPVVWETEPIVEPAAKHRPHVRGATS
jgi:long-chain acyl-CoA synthetase